MESNTIYPTADLHINGGFNRMFIRKHITATAIVLFSMAFILIQVIQPSFVYKSDGTLRTFGIGTKNKTVVPMWLIAILLSIMSYFIVLVYLGN